MGEGGHESDSCRVEEVEGVGMVGKSGEPGRRMGYHGNIMLRTNGGRRGRDRKPNSVWGGEGRGRDRKSDFVACGARIVSGWVVVACGTESYSGLAGNTFCIPGSENVSPGDGSDCQTGYKKHCVVNLFLFGFMICYFSFTFYYILWVKFLQNRQVMVTSSGLCCWPGRRVPRSPDC